MCLLPYFLNLYFFCDLGVANGLVPATVGIRNVKVPLFLDFLNPLVSFPRRVLVINLFFIIFGRDLISCDLIVLSL